MPLSKSDKQWIAQQDKDLEARLEKKLWENTKKILAVMPDKDDYVTRVEFQEFKAQFNDLQDVVLKLYETTEKQFASMMQMLERHDMQLETNTDKIKAIEARLMKKYSISA